MRKASLTFCCPMNSASRCGRRESSTTDSSAMTSGVVISARDTGCGSGYAWKPSRRYAESHDIPASSFKGGTRITRMQRIRRIVLGAENSPRAEQKNNCFLLLLEERSGHEEQSAE